MLDTDLYFACIDLRGRRALVVGGGPAAAEKADALCLSRAEVLVVAERAGERIQELHAEGKLRWEARSYETSDLDGCLLAIAAAEDRRTNERVFAEADERAMLVNVVDVPELCNFISPAIARRGPVAIAVTTSGASPALAQRVRREIEGTVDESYGTLARLLDAERAWARTNLPDYDDRKRFFSAIVSGHPDPISLLRDGDEAGVARLIETAKSEALR